MLNYAIAYLVSAAVFLGADVLWLSRMMPFYKSGLGDLLADRLNLKAAVVFYIVYIVGVVVFAVMPSAGVGSWLLPACREPSWGWSPSRRTI